MSTHVDGGLNGVKPYLPGIEYHPRGQGYAKINQGAKKRVTINLTSEDNTNNEVELFAILCGITFVCNKKKNERIIVSDSQWCVQAVTEKLKAKEPRLKLMISAINALLTHYKITLQWVRREENNAT